MSFPAALIVQKTEDARKIGCRKRVFSRTAIKSSNGPSHVNSEFWYSRVDNGVYSKFGKAGERIEMDTLTIQQRSYCMSRIHSKNTQPEMLVRKFLWSLGIRYRLTVAA